MVCDASVEEGISRLGGWQEAGVVCVGEEDGAPV